MALPHRAIIANIPFESISRYKNAFQKHAGKDAVNAKLSRAEMEKKGTFSIDTLPEMLKAINISLPQPELEFAMQALVRERQRALEVDPKHVPAAELGPNRVSFDDLCWVMTHCEFRFTLMAKETLAVVREQVINDFVRHLLSNDEQERAAAIKDPAGSLMGDKQAVRILSTQLHNLKNGEDVRVSLARGITAIAEKPREASGDVKTKTMPSGKLIKIYDNKAMSAFRHVLEYEEKPAYLDIRSFRNREPPQAPVELETDLVGTFKEFSATSKVRIVHELSTEREQENLYLHQINMPLHEPSDAVRIACTMGLYGVADTENDAAVNILLRVVVCDPGWTVRAAALDVLRLWATDIKKEGPLNRWGNKDRWYDEEFYPWRSRDEHLEFLWKTLLRVLHRDPAWQVRKRAVLTIAEIVDLGNEEIYAGLVTSLEDPSAATRAAAFKSLSAALFARGSYVSERNHRIQVHINEGMNKWDACVLGSKETQHRRGGVDSELMVVKVLIDRSAAENVMSRRAAVSALGDVIQRAKMRGDVGAVSALLRVVEDDADPGVQRAAVQSLWKTSIDGEETVITALKKVALSHKDKDVRKGAVEALEKLGTQGDVGVVETLSDCLKDPHAEVREAAVRALERAAEEGNPPAIAAAEGCLKDPSWFVRRAAARSLTMLEPEGEHQLSVSTKILGQEDKNWFAEVQAYLTKPLFYPI